MADSITVREELLDGDRAFIYSTWRNSSYYGMNSHPLPEPKEYFKQKTEEIDYILKDASVRIACFESDTLIGYSVYKNSYLYFIYVKADFRKQGLGKLLFPKQIETITKKLTKIGKAIVDKKGLKINEN